MRRYTADEERRIRLQQRVRDWSGSGLLGAPQASAIDARLRTDLRRTNALLRAALALFTAIVVAAVLGFVFVTTGIRDETSAAVVFAIAAVICFVVADYLAGTIRLYRHGVEETLASLSMVLTAFAVFLMTDPFVRSSPWRGASVLVVAAAAAMFVYSRFGFVYVAIAGMACVGVTPLTFHLSPAAQRAIAAALFAAMFVAARVPRRRHGDEFPGDEYGVLQAAACVGIYLALNLQIDGIAGVPTIDRSGHDAFYWATYIAIWIVPAAALTIAIREKDRPLLVVGLALALATLATNKPYLGLRRETWDPILLGLLLVGVAVAVKRWLAGGPGGVRAGYTADRIASRDRELLTVVGNLSVAVPPGVRDHPVEPAPAPPLGSGGRSGGGGGGAGY